MNINNVSGNFVVHSTISNNFTREIAHIPVLTAQEEKELFKQFTESKQRMAASTDIQVINQEKEFQVKIRQEIISRNQRFNYAIAKRYNNDEILMDLVSVGAIGMHEAFENYVYSEDNSVRFCTYAVYYIRRAINAYINKENLMVKTSNAGKILPKVKRIKNRYFAQNGCYPSADYITRALEIEYGIKDANPAEFNAAEISHYDQFDVDTESDSKKSQDSFMAKAKAVSVNDYESVEESEYNKAMVNNALRVLDTRETTIVGMAFGYGYDKEYKDYEIAEVLDLTPERVRQIKISALKKMRSAANKVYAIAY